MDGRLVDPGAPAISALDHGLTVGDGVFETVKVVDGVPFALTRHLQRLERSTSGLGLRVDLDRVRRGVDEVLAGDVPPLGRLRVTVTGGPGPLGSERGTKGCTVVVVLAEGRPWPETSDVVVAPWPRNERSALTGLKTTSYAENVVALAKARGSGADEAVFANTHGSLCEGTGSNVFLELDGRLVTPPLASGCLAGVTRALLLHWLPDTEELDVPLDALRTAREAFLASTTRDVQPIRRVDGVELSEAPGTLTRDAMRVFAERSAADSDP